MSRAGGRERRAGRSGRAGRRPLFPPSSSSAAICRSALYHALHTLLAGRPAAAWAQQGRVSHNRSGWQVAACAKNGAPACVLTWGPLSMLARALLAQVRLL